MSVSRSRPGSKTGGGGIDPTAKPVNPTRAESELGNAQRAANARFAQLKYTKEINNTAFMRAKFDSERPDYAKAITSEAIHALLLLREKHPSLEITENGSWDPDWRGYECYAEDDMQKYMKTKDEPKRVRAGARIPPEPLPPLEGIKMHLTHRFGGQIRIQRIPDKPGTPLQFDVPEELARTVFDPAIEVMKNIPLEKDPPQRSL